MKRERSYFRRWLQRILGWVGLGHRSSQQHPRILEEHYSDDAAVFLVACDEPGVVALWKVQHRKCRRDLIITLVNLAQLRQDLGQRRAINPNAPSFVEWQQYLERHLGSGLQDQIDMVLASHVVLITWVSRHSFRRVDSKGNVRFVTATEYLACVVCDLQGGTRAWAGGNLYANKIVRALVFGLLRLGHSESRSWEFRVRLIDWRGRLEAYACHKNTLGESHVLQPRKSRL